MSYGGYPGQGHHGSGAPPPQQYGGGQYGGGGYGQQPAQPQYGQYPPPAQQYGQPPPQQYGQGQYPPQHAGGYQQYPPQQQQYGQPAPQQYQRPPHPPPQGYDSYGYPIQQQSSNYGGGGGGGHRGPVHQLPSGSVEFGHGAPQGYTFQYSQCNGRRKALLIGINYFGQEGELRGCINDVKNLSAFLINKHNYKREDMILLTDDQQDPNYQPTKANIIRAMQWLVKDAQPNDALFLHYSGSSMALDSEDGGDTDRP